MIKKLFSVAVILAASVFCTATAGEPLRMAFQYDDGAVSYIDADGLTMKVSEQKLLASNPQSSLELDLKKLAKMYFTSGTSGVELASVDIAATVDAYTVDGRFAGRFPTASAAITSLPKGVYVLRSSDDKTLKIAVQ